MNVRLSIGDFSRMTHLSVKALRHYHQVGLLVPVEIDPVSGYRFYEPEQVPTAQVIRRFRDLGMPLDQIAEVLDAPDVRARNQILAAHLRRMQDQLAVTQATVASLRSLLERPPAPITVEHRSVARVRAITVAGQVAFADLDGWLAAAFGELDSALAAAAVKPAGPQAALYPAELFQFGAAEVIAFRPVAGEIQAAGPASMRDVPPAELAVAVHHGPLADIDQTYGALGSYVAAREIGVDGPIREHYLITAADTSDESRHVTEVCWPVFQTGSRSLTADDR